MNMRMITKLGAAAAVLAVFATTAADAPAFIASAFEAQERPAQPLRKWKVKLEDVHLRRSPDGNVFSGIVPCVKVIRSVWEAAQADQAYSLKFHLKYASDGKTAVKNIQIPLKTMNVSRGHASTPEYVVVTTVVDVARLPVDEGSKVLADVHLNHKPASR
jgi:hypothetical protein